MPRTDLSARDRVLDLVRLGAMVLVVIQHWLMPVLAVDGGAIDLDRMLVLERLWPVTWLTQVMPLVFFTAGAAAAYSLRRGARHDDGWVARRLVRLTGGVLVLGLVWVPLPMVLHGTGLPAEAVSTGGRLVGALLWFLVVLGLLTVLTPVLSRLAARCRGIELVVLAAAAVGVDTMRFAFGWELAGYINAVLVWAAVYIVGMHYARGRMQDWQGTRAVLLALGGLVVTAVAVAVGPYSPAMIGLPGTTVSNMNPPTAVMLALSAAQIGVLLAVRPVLARWVRRPRLAAAVDRWAPHTMTVYLWHTPAIVLVAAMAVALGIQAPPVGSAAWWGQLAVWFAAATVVLALSVAAVGSAGLRPPRAQVGRGRLIVGAPCALAGLGVLMVGGFDPARSAELAGPVVGVWALAIGAIVLGGRPTMGAPMRSTPLVAAGAGTAARGKVVL